MYKKQESFLLSLLDVFRKHGDVEIDADRDGYIIMYLDNEHAIEGYTINAQSIQERLDSDE